MAIREPRPELPDETSPTEETVGISGSITPRSLIIGFIAIIPGVFWGVYGDVVSQTDLTSMSLMMPPILILITLLLVNAGLKRLRPKWVLSGAELITIYAMLTVSVILSGMGMLQFLCTTLGAVPHYKTPANEWESYLSYVPKTIMPKLSAIDGFYKGNKPIPWSAWTSPILLWSGFLFAMLFCMICINTILRKQWVERERLSFPIVALPLEMTDQKSGFFRNRYMWLGFFIACIVETINSLNALYPNVPHLQIRAYDLAPFFPTHPWNAVGYFPTTLYPLTIGLGYVLSTDVSFSCWFFYLFTKLENVGTAALGWTGGPGGASTPPYLGQQGAGAFLGIVLMVVYLARGHLKEVIAHVFQGSKIDDSNEPMGYRTAVFGLIAGFLVMIGFAAYVGVSPWAGVLYLGIYLAFATCISRLRAEAGPAWTMGPYMDAMDATVRPLGVGAFGTRSLVGLAYFHWFSIEMRCCPMPVTVEGMKMAQATHIRQRTMTIVMLAAIVAGIAIGFWACLAVWYHFGAESAKVEMWRTNMGKAPFDRLTNYLKNPMKPDVPAISAMTFGACFTFFLTIMRTKFFWFPFHPAGYVLANTGTLYWLWFPFFIAWTLKTLIIRYGGIKGYRAALPFFLGLVLGDYTISSLWALAGSVLGIRMYRCFPC
jgi:hypothetical protein